MRMRRTAFLDGLHESAVRLFRSAGWAGVVGFGLLVFALSLDYFGNRTLAEEADALQQEAHVLASRLRHPAVTPVASDRQRLDAFYASLPRSSDLPELLVRLHGHALARGIRVESANYRSTPEAGTPLERITLELPAQGTYPLLRAWLEDVQTAMPEVALDAISLRRDSIGVTDVQARVRLLVFLRGVP